jgi:hypothetical protein
MGVSMRDKYNGISLYLMEKEESSLVHLILKTITKDSGRKEYMKEREHFSGKTDNIMLDSIETVKSMAKEDISS